MHMRTTLDIPEDLMNEAMKMSGIKTKSELVKMALQRWIAREKRKKIMKFSGKLDLNIDLDILRGRDGIA